MCDDLPCAGKILHPTLFQSNDPGAMTVMRQFQQECSFLSEIRHPNIVQYLGSYRDPETRLPVLLMELMDENLTHFLEQSQEPLPYHTQVNICHDVALALAYLHSNGIIHRDLSSNNVLLIGAGNRTKVTDFGMAKFFNINCTTITPQTMCPGTSSYMPPETLDDAPIYTKKLDTFSFGVLDVQIITRLFPNPGPRTKKVQDPRNPRRRLQEMIPEIERRKSHIDLIDPTHPLLPIAINCLSYSEEDRPSAQDLCHHLATLKKVPLYDDSVQQAQGRSRPEQSALADRERQLRKVQKEKEELQQEREELWREKEECNRQIQHLQQQLKVSDGQVRDKDAILVAKEEEIQELVKECEQKAHKIETRERQLHKLNQQLVASEEVIAQFQQNFLKSEKMIQELQEENQQLRQEMGKVVQQPMVTWKTRLILNWKTSKAAPTAMFRASTTVCGSIAYFRPAGSRQVHSYNLDTDEWSTLPECCRDRFALTLVNSLVTAVGGMQSGEYINTLLSLMEVDGRWKWAEHFPPMPTKRKLTVALSSGKALVVAGGEGEGHTRLATVEVMDTDTLQWLTAASLPNPLTNGTATVCEDKIFLVGGFQEGHWTKSVFTCSLSALVQSQTLRTKKKTWLQARKPSVWHTITDLPVKGSTCVTLNGQLLAVGGLEDKVINTIYSYNTETNSWEVISQMPTPRCWCLVAVLPGNKLMVVGGKTDNGDTDIVEIATAQ